MPYFTNPGRLKDFTDIRSNEITQNAFENFSVIVMFIIIVVMLVFPILKIIEDHAEITAQGKTLLISDMVWLKNY